MSQVLTGRVQPDLGFGAVVLARLDSSRLPGKALRPFLGVPLVEFVCRRLLAGGLACRQVALATTARPCDDALAAWGEGFGIHVHRGPTDDVALRFLECATALGWKHAARVNGDSPLVDGGLVHRGLHEIRKQDAAFATNLVPRTFPYGVALEVVELGFYASRLGDATPVDREHVTPHIYRALPPTTLCYFCEHGDLSTVRLCVDTPDDESRITGYLAAAGQNPISVDACSLAARLLKENP
jgi:spore coat polysaccharide biosynthesis protein SpsF